LLYLRQNLLQAAGVIVDSEVEAHNARKQGVIWEKILLIPNGIELTGLLRRRQEAKYDLGLEANRPVLLYLEQLHPKKGLHVLLQAMALLPTYKRKFTLLVAGTYCNAQYRSRINALVQSGGLQMMVRFTEPSTNAQRESHYQAADGFILPALQNEGLPQTVLEAMAHGLPVIITKACNLPEVSDYRAGLVTELSVSNLTLALKWFLSGEATLTNASLNAFKLVKERFSLEQSVLKYRQIIDEHAITVT
jgi:poly(glycerol-phosphate) alpha-glucosyltransferase